MAAIITATVQLTEAEVVSVLPGTALDITGVNVVVASPPDDSTITMTLDAPNQSINDDLVLGLIGAPFDDGSFYIKSAARLNLADGTQVINFELKKVA